MVGVEVAVSVAVDVIVGVAVFVAVKVGVGVTVRVGVAVAVLVGVRVATRVPVRVGVSVGAAGPDGVEFRAGHPAIKKATGSSAKIIKPINFLTLASPEIFLNPNRLEIQDSG